MVFRPRFLPTPSTRQSLTIQIICFNELRLCPETFRITLRKYKIGKKAFDYCKNVNFDEYLLHRDQENYIWFLVCHFVVVLLSVNIINQQNVSLFFHSL